MCVCVMGGRRGRLDRRRCSKKAAGGGRRGVHVVLHEGQPLMGCIALACYPSPPTHNTDKH